MRDTWPLLEQIAFPPIRRGRLDTLQVNVGYRCNQSCVHCHVNAGPNRSEEMSAEVIDVVLAFLAKKHVTSLDITGGAPELNRHFRRLVRSARDMGVRVTDRCNLTVLEVPGQQDLADFLAGERVEIVASLPCYLEDNVDRQRGTGVFEASIRGLKRLNALGYGREHSGLVLDLVYNPQGPALPPPQAALEADYRRVLGERHGIAFNHLYTLANMPIQRVGAILFARGDFARSFVMLLPPQVEIAVDFPPGDQDRAKALDRHVGERVEVVERDAVAFAEHAPVVGLERGLRRRQRRSLRIVDEVEHEPAVLAPVAERVESFEAADGGLEHPRPALAVDIVLEVARQGSDDLDPLAGEKVGEVLLSGHLQNGEVAAVQHPHAHVAGRAHQAAEMRIELRRPAGDVEGRDALLCQEGEHHVDHLGRHFLAAVRPGIDVAMDARLIAAIADIDLERV